MEPEISDELSSHEYRFFNEIEGYLREISRIRCRSGKDVDTDLLKKALASADEGYITTGSGWMKCLMAELLVMLGDPLSAYETYLSLADTDDLSLRFHLYLKLIQLHLELFEELQGIHDLCVRCFSGAGVINENDIPLAYPVYISFIESSFELASSDELTELLRFFDGMNCAQARYLKVYYLIKKNKMREASDLYMEFFDRAFSHAERFYNHEFVFGRSAEKSDSTDSFLKAVNDDISMRSIIRFKDDERYDYQFIFTYPVYSDYTLLTRVKDESVVKVRELSSFWGYKLKNIVKYTRGESNSTCDPGSWYIKICTENDHWYGLYSDLYNYIRIIASYLEDTEFFFSDTYQRWIDHYVISAGSLHYRRHMARDEYWRAKMELLGNIAESCPVNKQLMKTLSDRYCDHAELLIKKSYDKKITKSDIDILTKAEELLKVALHFAPHSDRALFNYGSTLLLLRRRKEAADFLMRVKSGSAHYSKTLQLLEKIAREKRD